MAHSWNDIRERAREFSKEFEDERREHAEARTFWDAFFAVFGLRRRKVASFEVPSRKGDGQGGYIDLLWKGVLIVVSASTTSSPQMESRGCLSFRSAISTSTFARSRSCLA